MNDKELLMLAAWAAGIKGEWNEPCGKFEKLSDKGWHIGFFEPLTDNGDALRLAVKLDMNIDIQGAWIRVDCGDDFVSENANGDPISATRRAIVRAAAAIGEKL